MQDLTEPKFIVFEWFVLNFKSDITPIIILSISCGWIFPIPETSNRELADVQGLMSPAPGNAHTEAASEPDTHCFQHIHTASFVPSSRQIAETHLSSMT